MATVRGTSVSVVCVGVVMAVSWLAVPTSAQAPAPRRGLWVYEKLVPTPERLPPACPPQGVILSRPHTDYWVEGGCITLQWLPHGLKVYSETRDVRGARAGYQDGATQWTAPPRTLTPGQPLSWTTSAETLRCRPTPGAFGTDVWFQSISPTALSDNVPITFPGSRMGDCTDVPPSPSTVNGAPKVPEPNPGAAVPTRMSIRVNLGMRGLGQTLDYLYVFDEKAVPDSRPVDVTRELGITEVGNVDPNPPPSGACGEPSGVSGPASPAAATETTLEAAKRQVRPGTAFTLPVWLAKASNLGSMNLVARFDPAVVKLEGVPGKGKLIREGTSIAVNPDAPGVVEFGFATGASGLTGTDSVLDLKFRAVGKAGARTPIRLEVKNAESPENTPVRVARLDGTVEIVDCSSQQNETPPLLLGDCNGNGVLEAVDALCALHMSVNLRPTDLKVDMDGNKRVTAADANIILRKVVGR